MTNIANGKQNGETSLLTHLSRLRSCCVALEQEVRARAHLTEAQFTLLLQLASHDEITTGELCTLAALSPSRGGRVVEELVSLGLIERRMDEGDRRVSRLKLSREGRAVHDRLDSLRQACERDILSEIAPGDLETIRSGLEALDAALARVLSRKVTHLFSRRPSR